MFVLHNQHIYMFFISFQIHIIEAQIWRPMYLSKKKGNIVFVLKMESIMGCNIHPPDHHDLMGPYGCVTIKLDKIQIRGALIDYFEIKLSSYQKKKGNKVVLSYKSRIRKLFSLFQCIYVRHVHYFCRFLD